MNKVALSFGMLVSATSAAFAADAITVPLSTQEELPIVEPSTADWSGFYAGIYGTAQTAPSADTQYGLGVAAGINAQIDFYLVGAEVAIEGLTDEGGDTTQAQALGRAGLAVTDDVLVYAAGGYEVGNVDGSAALAGGGLEIMMSDDVSVRGQYLQSFPAQGTLPRDQFTLGANFHF